jgi:hypothetical protein
LVWIGATNIIINITYLKRTNQPTDPLLFILVMSHRDTSPVATTRIDKRVPQQQQRPPSSLLLQLLHQQQQQQQQQRRPKVPQRQKNNNFHHVSIGPILVVVIIVAVIHFNSVSVQAQRQTQDNDTCLWNNLEFMRGESFGSAFATQCSGPTTDFPCFCNPDLAPFPADCPYCSFPQLHTEDLACARNGETISFIDPDGISQQCSCSISNSPGALPITSCNSNNDNGGMPTVAQGTSSRKKKPLLIDDFLPFSHRIHHFLCL